MKIKLKISKIHSTNDITTFMYLRFYSFNNIKLLCEVYELMPARDQYGRYCFWVGTTTNDIKALPCPVEGCDQDIVHEAKSSTYGTRVCAKYDNHKYYDINTVKHYFVTDGSDERPMLIRKIKEISKTDISNDDFAEELQFLKKTDYDRHHWDNARGVYREFENPCIEIIIT